MGKKKKNKKSINWKELAITSAIDFFTGLILLILDKIIN